MNAKFISSLCLAMVLLACFAEAQRFRNNNNNNNNNNRNNFQNNNNNNRNNFQNNNNNNNNNPNYRHVEPIYSYGLDTSSGQYSKFNGPVKGLPAGHGGGKYGAADCLLC